MHAYLILYPIQNRSNIYSIGLIKVINRTYIMAFLSLFCLASSPTVSSRSPTASDVQKRVLREEFHLLDCCPALIFDVLRVCAYFLRGPKKNQRVDGQAVRVIEVCSHHGIMCRSQRVPHKALMRRNSFQGTYLVFGEVLGVLRRLSLIGTLFLRHVDLWSALAATPSISLFTSPSSISTSSLGKVHRRRQKILYCHRTTVSMASRSQGSCWCTDTIILTAGIKSNRKRLVENLRSCSLRHIQRRLETYVSRRPAMVRWGAEVRVRIRKVPKYRYSST